MKKDLTYIFKNHPIYIFKDFRRVFLGRVISAIGDKFFQIALVWWVMGVTHGKLNVGLIMAANFLPVVLFGPFLGSYVDKSNKKKNMLIADFFRAFFAFILFVLLYYEFLNIYLALTLVFLISSFAPLFEISVASSLLKLTSKEHLSQATATDSSSTQLSNVFGAVIGSIFIAIIGIKGAFFLNSLSYLISFLFIWQINSDLSHKKSEETNFKNTMKDGFKYIFSNKPILYLVIFFAFLNFFVSPIFILIPMIVKFMLQLDAKWLAIFEAFFALGLATVSIALSFKTNYSKPYMYLFSSIILNGIFFLLLGFNSNKYFSISFLLFMGSAISLGNVVILSLFQNTISEEYKGRFFSIITTISYAIMPLSFLVHSVIAEKVSVEFDIFLNSIATIILSFIVLIIPKIKNDLKSSL